MIDLKSIKLEDEELYDSMVKELNRQQYNIELIASENIVTPAVMAAAGSHFTNKYAEGYPGARYYGGCEFVDIAEDLARDRLKELFGAKFANVQPHSGANANLATYYALLKPGDVILGMSLDAGGHLTHGCKFNVSGKVFKAYSYGLKEDGTIDFDQVREMALEYKPQLIVAGASAYPRTIDFKKFREIADEVGAKLMVDMAHIAGLVAAGVHPSPIGIADVVTSTTHKTLRGPRGGIILTNDEAIAKAIDKAIFPCSQGGPLMHIIAAKAVAFKEALQPEFKTYAQQIVKNAKVLAQTLLDRGLKLVSGGTDNHLMLLDLTGTEVTGKDLEDMLGKANITVNKNKIPNDPQPASLTSGVRIGTPAVTTRGMKEEDMVEIGNCIADIAFKKESAIEDVKSRVIALCKKYPLYAEDVIF